MDGVGSNPKMHSQSKAFHFFELALRLCVIPLTLSSLLVIVSSNQTSDLYGTVEFNNLSGFKYLISINAISGVYSLGSVFISKSRCFKMYDWVLFVLDQMTTYLMVTSGSAVSEILYLAEKGDREVSWSEVCSYFGSFCQKTKVSLGLHFVALLCFIVLSLISAFRLFSKFDAPSSSLANMEENGK
ncbi:CASP-like protein [Rhynchospora pubera]|uniref:CASP-like protein n=1 Tax=Rhynchospora pubera TaxID=906938 RepID=A0AAV8EQP6_9POAL|nr:CASP-like protein [Rhynchospora pubera]KAJ4789950.1 CASP-like protein [Rhynchospora pubera]